MQSQKYEDPRKNRIEYRIVTDSDVEELVRNEGWTNLRWGPPNPDRDDRDIGWKLSACPPDYDGPYVDHTEYILKQKEKRVDGKRQITYEVVGDRLPKRVAEVLEEWMRIR